MKTLRPSFLSIIPLIVFIAVFLGSGLINDDFYALPSPIAALLGIVTAFLIFKAPFKQKIETFLKGIGDDKILTMCIIYLLAGAFATVTKASGSVDTIVNIGIAYVSPQYFAGGVFVMASFLSFASGTSVGSIVTLAPIVIELAEKSGAPLGFVGAALLCGAMFGDNLSVISDTTIAATQSLGCHMKDKLKANLKLALPAALVAFTAFILSGTGIAPAQNLQEPQVSHWLLIMPYVLVICFSLIGINVFITLFSGLVFAGALGLFYGKFEWMEFAELTYKGFTEMTEIFLLSLLTGGLAALVEKAGGITFLLRTTERFIKGPKSALAGIGALVGITNLAVANNTIAILISGKIAKEINDKYHLPSKVSASQLDIFACYVQGLIPYGAQILILISLSNFKIGYLELLTNAYYLHFLIIITLISTLTFKIKTHD